jgi:multiple sugar transport system permease protein
MAAMTSGNREARRFSWRALVFYLFTVPLVLIWLVPAFTALVTSVRSFDDIVSNGYWTLPESIELGNFGEAWTNGGLSTYMANSFIITLPALVITLALSSMAAFALARFHFRGNLVIYFTFVGGTLLPFQILMLPVWKLSNVNLAAPEVFGVRLFDLGFNGVLYNTYWVLIIFHAAFQLGFCTFVLRNFMRTIPGEIFDAARIDGASEFRIYRQHVLPLSLPSIAALATLEFTWIFNDYLWALILLRDTKLKPVTTGLSSLMGEYQRSWNILFAGTLIATVPTILLFIFLQRYFIQGLTLGSGK